MKKINSPTSENFSSERWLPKRKRQKVSQSDSFQNETLRKKNNIICRSINLRQNLCYNEEIVDREIVDRKIFVKTKSPQ